MKVFTFILFSVTIIFNSVYGFPKSISKKDSIVISRTEKLSSKDITVFEKKYLDIKHTTTEKGFEENNTTSVNKNNNNLDTGVEDKYSDEGWDVPDQSSLRLYFINNNFAPENAVVTKLEYRLRIIDNPADSSGFYSGDFEILLSSSFNTNTVDDLLVYDNLGTNTDGGFDDDLEDDNDIFLNSRSTDFFNGELANQYWGIVIKDNLALDSGFLEYIELIIYWDSADSLGQQIVIVSPNGGEIWQANSVQNITWTSENVDNVKIEYTSDNDSTWTTIASSTENDGSYNWTIPNISSAQCKVRISDSSDPTIVDESDTPFTISGPTIKLISPTEGEIVKTWIINFSWEDVTNATSYRLNVRGDQSIGEDGGFLWAGGIISKNYSYDFSFIHESYIGSTLYWGVQPIDSNGVQGNWSEIGSFVYDPQNNITITSPNGGENWEVGSTQNITWTSENVDNVKIEYSPDNGSTWTTIVSLTASDGSYEWIVPNTPSTQCRVKIIDVTNPSVFDVSDAIFTLAEAQPSIVLTSPNGGEIWQAGNQTIRWNSYGVSVFKIEFTADNGSTWTKIITTSYPGNGEKLKTVKIPNKVSSLCKIKISDNDNPSIFDESDEVFTVTEGQHLITVTSPNGGEYWQVGSEHDIRWSSENVEDVKIEYSINNGSSWNIILTNAPALPGFHTWTIPNIISTQYKVKISDASIPSLFDESDGVFVVTEAQRSITVTSPNGGENWQVGSEHDIAWESGIVNNVKIEYSADNGNSWITETTSTVSDGNYKWVIPNLPSSQCKVKISDVSNPDIFDESNGLFTIISSSQDAYEPNDDITTAYGPIGLGNWYSAFIESETDEDWYKFIISSSGTSSLSQSGIHITQQVLERLNTKLMSKNFIHSQYMNLNDNSLKKITEIENVSVIINLTVPNGFDYELRLYDQTGNELSSSTGNSNEQIIIELAEGTYYIRVYGYSGEYSQADSYSIRAILSSSNSEINLTAYSGIDYNFFEPTSGFPGDTFTNFFRVKNTGNVESGSFIVRSFISDTSFATTYQIGEVTVQSLEAESYIDLDIICTLPNNITMGDYYISDHIDPDNLIEETDEADNRWYKEYPFFTINDTQIKSLSITSPTNGKIFRTGTSQSITWTKQNIENVKIEYRVSNISQWITIIESTPASSNSYTWTVPNTESNNCKVRISDASNSSILSESGAFTIFVYPTTFSLSNIMSFGSISETSSFRMIGIPGDVDVSIPMVLNGASGEDWKVFRDDGSEPLALKEWDGSSSFNLGKGRAFWIVSKKSFNVSNQVSSGTLNATNSYSIPLHSGWNMITNPFTKTVSWSDVKTLNNVSENIHFFNGTYSSSINLEPYNGYYFYNATNLNSLEIPFITSSSSLPKTQLAAKKELIINLESGKYLSQIFIGFDDSSKIGYDKNDQFTPPGNFDVMNIQLKNDNLETSYKYLMSDYRSEIGEGQIYDVKVKLVPGETYTFKIDGLEIIESNEAYLIYERLSKIYNLKEQTEFKFNGLHETNDFKLVIGKSSFVDEMKEQLIPKEFVLYQNYPNPFNPNTVIRFSLPEISNVSITVYNVLGEVVNRLIHYKIYQAGNYETLFEGNRLTSGVYIYEIIVHGQETDKIFTTALKMLYVK